MLLLIFVLVFVSSVVLPGVDFAGQAVQEVERIGQARLAAEKMADTANRLQNLSSGAQQTIAVFIPTDVNLLCDSIAKKIGFAAALHTGSATACQNDNDNDDFTCTKFFDVYTTALSCNPNTTPFVQGKQSARIAISKSGSGIAVKKT